MWYACNTMCWKVRIIRIRYIANDRHIDVFIEVTTLESLESTK